MSRIIGPLETTFEREYKDSELISRFAKFALPYRKHLYFTILAIISGAILSLAIPFTLQLGVDNITTNPDLVVVAALAFLGLNVGVWISNYFNKVENTRFVANSTRDIRQSSFSKVQYYDMRFYDTHNTGELMTRIMDDTQVLADFLGLTGNIVSNVFIAGGTVVILLLINPVLTLLALSVVPFLVGFIFVFRRIARTLTRRWRKTITALNESFQENISGISVSKSFGRIDKSNRQFESLNASNYKVNRIRTMFFSSIFPVVFATSNVGLYLVLFYGGLSSISTGNPSVGTLVLYVAFLQRFYFPIVLITTYYQQLQAGLAAAERIFALLDVEPTVTDSGTEILESLKGNIEFENVTFSYDDDTIVFDNFSLKIPASQTIAIVGHTGAGKSTIMSLILRFYLLNSGRIKFDGKDITNYTLKSLRSKIGIVLQDPTLFSGTIRSNIAYGIPEANDEDIRQAAKAANLWEFIEGLPDGLDTVVSERGKRLSHGQKQLIALARAFLIDPQVLLLDEATASIDAYSEALIQEAIEKLLYDRTNIIIAHRLTTVQRADRIIVLDNGKIIEDGNHEQLLAKDGHYAELFQKYFAFQALQV